MPQVSGKLERLLLAWQRSLSSRPHGTAVCRLPKSGRAARPGGRELPASAIMRRSTVRRRSSTITSSKSMGSTDVEYLQ